MATSEQYHLQNKLLDLVMQMNELESDYALSKHLDIPLQTIRNWRLNKTKMGDTACLQIAQELKMEPMQVIARVRMDGNPSPRVRRVWGKYLGRLLLGTVALAITAAPTISESRANIGHAGLSKYTLCALICAARRKRRKWICEISSLLNRTATETV